MKIVIDTNVLISGVFFSGAPRKAFHRNVGEYNGCGRRTADGQIKC